jgi:hypothetical protein
MARTEFPKLSNRFPATVREHAHSLTPPGRGLSPAEVEKLRAAGNYCADWSLVRVADEFRPAGVVGNHIIGSCYLPAYDPARINPLSGLPCGVYHSTLHNSILEGETSVHRCAEISSYRIRTGAAVVGSSLRCAGETSFGNGTEIEPGIETGGRSLVLLADLDLDGVIRICRPSASTDPPESIQQEIADYCSECRVSVGNVGVGAGVRNCRNVENAWVGDGAVLSAVTLLSSSTVLSTPDEPTTIGPGAIVRSSVVQEGCTVTDGALVDSSLMLEHSHVERHGKLTAGVLGPNSGVAEGEATACIIGPFTAFHHQALLIAAFWPAGKGNVGYGANVGSNHTSRLPDQEIWPGEGMFFGLGCNVKFPADFSRAPYTIISTGVTTLPQRVEMPFSVITTPVIAADVPPGLNQLLPGWVLRENLYALLRNEAKYRKRNKARRTPIELAVFRDDTVSLMQIARDWLAEAPDQKQIHLPGDIRGIGKNIVTEEDRQAGIRTYDRYIEYHQLALRVAALTESVDTRRPNAEDRETLQRFLEHRRNMILDARRSREKDWRRGVSCIDDYSVTHPEVDQDEVILSLEKEYTGQEASISSLLNGI